MNLWAGFNNLQTLLPGNTTSDGLWNLSNKCNTQDILFIIIIFIVSMQIDKDKRHVVGYELISLPAIY